MNILAFESSCDETAAAVVRDGRTVLSDAIASQADMHALYGGVVPEIASRKHVEAIAGLADAALAEAGLRKADVDAVAVTYGPGLIGALLVGVNFAKSVAYGLGVPLIPVHHVRGHISANYIAHPELEPPFVCLCVSGGTTLIVDVRDYTEMAVLGATRDDAAGECFDKVARVLGIGYPGGAPMDRLSRTGDAGRYAFPRVMEAALRCGRRKVAVAGGVAANSHIRADLEAACAAAGCCLYLPPLSLCGDNGAMIGCQAYYEYLAGHTADMALNAYANRDIAKG